MKRIIAICLSLVLIACVFSACSNEVTSSNDITDNKTAILEGKENGKIPEIDYALGDNPDGIKKHFDDLLAKDDHSEEENHNHSHDEVTNFTITEGISTVKMDAGKFVYHYEKDKKANGISVIVSYTKAFGFTAGETIMQEVSDCFEQNSITTFTASEDDMYFLVYPLDDCMILRNESDNIRLDFYFSENVLVAVVLMDKNNWTV